MVTNGTSVKESVFCSVHEVCHTVLENVRSVSMICCTSLDGPPAFSCAGGPRLEVPDLAGAIKPSQVLSGSLKWRANLG